MRGAFRALIVAAAMAVGSWVGLHPHGRTPEGPAPVATPAASADRPIAEAPPPETLGAKESAVPGFAPWPRLNPEASISKAWRLAEGPHRRAGDRRKLVTLTFDDGPFPETTPRVLELLAKHDVHATFFVIGRYLDGDGERAQASREVLQKTAAAGHLIGNHTHDHSLLTNVTHTQVLEQIDRGAASIERAIGKKPFLLRPPYGELDDFGQAAARERGLDVVLWNIETKDMERDDSNTMYRELVHQLAVKQGGVVLLHDIRWPSVKILERLLDYLDAKKWDPARPDREGYVVVDLPTYFRELEAAPPQSHVRASRGTKPALPVTRR